MANTFYTSTARKLSDHLSNGRLPDGTPIFLDAKANYIKVGDLVWSQTSEPTGMGIVMELITDDPLLSLGYDVRIVKVKWLRSGVGSTYPHDLVVIAK